MNPQMKAVMKYNEELFQYIVDHSIKNEQHYNKHLKYDILVQLERKVTPTISPRLKITAFNQALQQDERLNFLSCIINNGINLPNARCLPEILGKCC